MTSFQVENRFQRIAEILSSIGFSKNEILIYLSLLKGGHSSALMISKKTGIHRTNIYDSLRALINKGFVYEVPNGDKKEYSALSIEKLVDFFNRKGSELKEEISKMKEFINLDSEAEGKSQISISRGVFALKSRLYDLLDEKKPIKICGYSDAFDRLLGEAFMRDYLKEISKHRLDAKIISNNPDYSTIGRYKKTGAVQIKSLPSTVGESKIMEFVCGDIFGMCVLLDSPFCLIFKNGLIANNFGGFFRSLWSVVKNSRHKFSRGRFAVQRSVLSNL